MDISGRNKRPSECPICDGTGTNTHVEKDEIGIRKFVEYPCQCQKDGDKPSNPYPSPYDKEQENFMNKLGEISDSKSSKCEFYNKNYCIPCRSPEKFYECEMVKIGNQIKINKWKPSEHEDTVWSEEGAFHEKSSRHMWSHLTDVSYCNICKEFAHNIGYGSECIIEKESTDDFLKVENKPYWLIPKDIDDFLRNYPSDGVRVKYDRLLENLPKKIDLEFLFKYGDGNYEPCGHDDDDFNDLRKKYIIKKEDEKK